MGKRSRRDENAPTLFREDLIILHDLSWDIDKYVEFSLDDGSGAGSDDRRAVDPNREKTEAELMTEKLVNYLSKCPSELEYLLSEYVPREEPDWLPLKKIEGGLGITLYEYKLELHDDTGRKPDGNAPGTVCQGLRGK